MKEIEELNLPEDVRYTEDHEWAKRDGGEVVIGVSDYAQDQLGDIVFVEVPDVGATYKKGDVLGTLESVKAVGEIYTPVSGEVTAVNTALEGSPGLVNQSPYAEGWIAKVAPEDVSELESLMTGTAYLAMLKGIKE